MEIIERFVDLNLDSLASIATPEWDPFYISKKSLTDNNFIDPEKEEIEGQIAWKAIPSLIEDSEISKLEQELKFKLPDSFKYYLKYKNFFELDVLSNVLMFTPLMPEIWAKKILDSTFNGYPREFIYDKGLIPFTNYSDWGLTCFNTNNSSEGSDYQIVVWDHENPEEFETKAKNFASLLESIVDNYENNKDGVIIIE
ncbi:hypothetical protein GCM10009122_26740 [Fulvivirga kasyanovii]|uniref:SMI1/KNR4 family protein n=1 Tax=Fulvivirga kasyanovii TaxID=396812 RepID=A0ABW9RPQ3_9BACT|nr:SMI1/KNR4 family protein [Fulvivirga kasyanovii]MTI26124.1 SMI1/KNR4 family protein [Fulvivirga kasyanovii]